MDKKGKFCSNILFLDLPHVRKRKQCGNLLMKPVVSSDGKKTLLYPIKVYCYTTVKQSIQKLLQQTDFSTNLLRSHHSIQNRDTYNRLINMCSNRNIAYIDHFSFVQQNYINESKVHLNRYGKIVFGNPFSKFLSEYY